MDEQQGDGACLPLSATRMYVKDVELTIRVSELPECIHEPIQTKSICKIDESWPLHTEAEMLTSDQMLLMVLNHTHLSEIQRCFRNA